jgi:flagellar motor switch protein FliM
MASQDHEKVIHRKARPARDGCESRAMSSAKALRLSLARAADTLFDLALTVATVEQQRARLDQIDGILPEDGLILLLDGSGGARGAVCLDQQMMAALIEVQTTGRVRKGTAQPRPPTRTDAAMMAPLVDALMDGVDAEMGAEVDGYQPRGFCFGDRVDDLRSLALTLDAPAFEHFRVTVDLGPGAKTGWLDLLLPVRADPPKRPAASDRSAPDTAQMSDVILGAPVVLDAVLARLSLPLREACALKPGQTLPLDRETLTATRLVTAGGHLVAEARLGQVNGWRALRLVSAHAAPLPDLAEPAPRADDTPGPPALRETDSQKQAPPQAPRQDATPSPPANATAEEGADPP